MNLLTTPLVETVTINTKRYKLNTHFRAALLTMLAFENAELLQQEKTEIMLRNLYPVIPEDSNEAIVQALRFLNGGEDEQEGQNKPRVFSFSKDSQYIFAAFRQTHGINLTTADLHWHEFLALFMDLGSETVFCNIVSLRSRLKNGTASKEEKKMALSMRDVLDLPELDESSLEEREASKRFLELLEKGRKLRETT